METFAAGNICSYYYGIWETLSFLTENERVYIMINQAFSNHQQFNLIPKRPCLYRKLILNLAAFSALLAFSSVLRAEEPESIVSAKELKELAPKIEAVENSISNIKIEAQSWLETKTDFYDPCESWQKTPICHLYTVWVGGGTEGKARVDLHKQVTKWKDGPAPYGEESYSVSFDGRHGRYVRHAFGPIGETHPVKRGQVLPEAPKSLNPRKLSGLYYSLPFFDSEIFKFSKIFQLAGDPNSEVASELEFTLEEFEGAQCIKIRSRLYDVTYWLEPSRGFALRGKKSIARHEDGHEEIVNLLKVTKLKKVASGLCWPMEVFSVSRPYAPVYGDGWQPQAAIPWGRLMALGDG